MGSQRSSTYVPFVAIPFEVVSEETVNSLSTLESVTLKGASANFAARLGRALIGLEPTFETQAFGSADLLSLALCPCLKSLRIEVSAGTVVRPCYRKQ